MTQYAYPLNDTEYLAEQVRLFHSARTAGIINATGNDLEVTSAGGMTVNVSEGIAFLLASTNGIGGITYANDEEVKFTIDTASAFDRYDYISVRYDKSLNTCILKYVKGSATMPTPVRNVNQYEIILATILVKNNTASITDADISDQRLNEDYCGLAVDGLIKLPTDQFQRQFSELMKSIQGTLTGDAAGNLLNKINANTKAIEQNTTSITDVSHSLEEHKNSVGYVVVTDDPEVNPPTEAKDGWLVLQIES